MEVSNRYNLNITTRERDISLSRVVYSFIFPSGKRYIGITTHSFKKRLYTHCSRAFNKNIKLYHSKVYCAIRKYRAFEIEFLYQGDDLETKEREFILLYDTFNNGYNLTSGGEYNKELSIETRKKISNSLIGNPSPRKGVLMSDELKAIISESVKEGYRNGRKHPRQKTVYLYDQQGNLLQTFENTVKAAQYRGVGHQSISRFCTGKRKDIKGYVWTYNNNINFD